MKYTLLDLFMIRKELDQAIPPAYTEWIGEKLLTILEGKNGVQE